MASINKIINKIHKQSLTGTILCVDKSDVLSRIYYKNGLATTAQHGHGREEIYGTEAFLLIIKDYFPKSAKFHKNINLVRSKEKIDQSEEIFTQLTPELKMILSEELAEVLGPVAEIVVDDLDDKLTLKQAIAELVKEISEQDKALEFINSVKNKIVF